MDLPRRFAIRESSHRILNPFTTAKLAILGAALHLEPGTTFLDLACGKGELLCTWARDHDVSGTGVDISTVFLAAARDRAEELGVADQVTFVHADASTYVADDPVDVACCCGATWIGDGVAGTVALLEQSLRPGGLMLIGEPFWRSLPSGQQPVAATPDDAAEQWLTLPGLVEQFNQLGLDVVEMVLADQDSWDRYTAAQWFNVRRWLDANPGDELWDEMRDDLTRSQRDYVEARRDQLGWGIFALRRRQSGRKDRSSPP